MMMTTETLGDLVRRRRRELGLSQTELADRVGRKQTWLSAVETGRNRLTRDVGLALLADALGIDYDTLAVAAGVVHRRNAAAELRRQARAMSADERARLTEAHAALDPCLMRIGPDDLATLVRVAESLVKRSGATSDVAPDRDPCGPRA